ncbi:MAG: efflux RND transporter permease subunit, partial [Schwartzia sp.]|nr:efflux RND transporter permease subunit [Schwartzia sp. (in: firmicutes)]
IAEGETLWDAIIDAAVLRFRPIMLTAGTDILGMIPLMTSPFWAPMAVVIAAGLIIATFLTLLVLPVMYAAVYRAKEA